MSASSIERVPRDPANHQSNYRLGSVMVDGFVEEREPQPVERAESVERLLERYKKPISDGWLVEFHELPVGISAYNASRMFRVGEVPHMLVREEGHRPDQELTSRLAIYQCSEDGRHCWPPTVEITNLKELTKGRIAQDPAISFVKDNWVLTWVEVTLNNPNDPLQDNVHKSVIAIGRTLDKLERLVESDEGTKGVRFVELLDGRIGISTRPVLEGECKVVCFTIANSWKDVTTELLKSAKEVEGLSVDGAWAGPNDMALLANGDISMPMHLGQYVENGIPNNRIYDAAHCVLTPEPENNPGRSAKANYLKIIARAEDFNISTSEAPPKRPDLNNILYTSWLRIARKMGGDAIWMGGFRDKYVAGIEVPDPLEEWRADHPEFADNPFPQSTDRLVLAA